MENYNSVDETTMGSVWDDAAQAPENADALTQALEHVAAAQDGQDGASGDDGQHEAEPESKALKGRMKQYEQRGYKRAMRMLDEERSKWEQEKRDYETQLSEYKKYRLEAEAKALAKEKNIPEDFALEYLQMKSGAAPAQSAPRAQPAGADDAVKARASALMAQAEAFEKISDGAIGRDAILDAFQNDPEIRERVSSGEWDFADVGKQLMGGQGKSRSPRANRAANNGRISESTFASMGDEDFAKFDERIRLGAVFDARR